MTAEELNSVRDKKRAIRETENRLQIMRLTVGSLQPAFDGLPGGNERRSPVETLMIKIMSLEEELTKAYRELDAMATALYEKISSAALTPREHEVMTLRYVSCEHFRDIAFMLKLSDARVYALHADGVRKILRVESGNS